MSSVWPWIFLLLPVFEASKPVFDMDGVIRVLYLPTDTPIGTVVYRLRAIDNDPIPHHPLRFSVIGDTSITKLIGIEHVSERDANMVLLRALERRRIYPIQVQVTDTNNEQQTMSFSISATDSHASPDLVFTTYPRYPVSVPEDFKLGTTHQIASVRARKNPNLNKYPRLILSDSDIFAMDTRYVSNNQIEGWIFLTSPLDSETQSAFMLNITVLDGFREEGKDNRNIVIIPVTIVVDDVEDTNPVFSSLPPIKQIPSSTRVGESVLVVVAKDGDRSNKFSIIYSLSGRCSELFRIDPISGVVSVATPLNRVREQCGGNGVVLDVTAQENGGKRSSTTKQVVILVSDDGPVELAAPVEKADPDPDEQVSHAWKWVLVALLVLLALVLITLCLCCLFAPRTTRKTISRDSQHQSEVVEVVNGGGARRHNNFHRTSLTPGGHIGNGHIHAAPLNASNGNANANVHNNVYSRHMRSTDMDVRELVDPNTGKKYQVRSENGRRILVRADEGQGRQVNRGTNVTESSMQADALMADDSAILLDDDGRRNQFLERKSLFTIAYDGMHSRNDVLRDSDDSTSPPTVS